MEKENEKVFMCDHSGCGRAMLVIVICVVLAALLFGGCGCAHLPKGMDSLGDLISLVRPAGEGNGKDGGAEAPRSQDDAVDYSALSWRIGRDQPSVENPQVVARIRAGSISSSKLTFSWEDAAAAGIALGSSTHKPAELRAYVFFGGEGGFFDWCSVTRVERDFHNIQGDWQGWDKVDKARRPVAFFIGSKDGKSRTNIIGWGIAE